MKLDSAIASGRRRDRLVGIAAAITIGVASAWYAAYPYIRKQGVAEKSKTQQELVQQSAVKPSAVAKKTG